MFWTFFEDILVTFWRHFCIRKVFGDIFDSFGHILEICGTTIRQEYLDIISIHLGREINNAEYPSGRNRNGETLI